MSLTKLDKFLRLEDSNSMKNRDIVPIPLARRRWNMLSYLSYWSIICLCMSTWTGAAALYDLGLNGPQALGVVIVGNALITALTIGNSLYGSEYHIGYSVFQRILWGTNAAWIGVLLRSILSVVWFAAQAWVGGLCVNVMLGTLSSRYLNMKNTFPESVGFRPDELVGFVIFLLVQMPLLFVKPEYFDFMLILSSVVTFVASFALALWVCLMVGNKGDLMNAPIALSRTDHAWAWIYGINTWYSGLIAGIANQSDYARFNKRPSHSHWGTILGVNIAGLFVPLLALFCSSSFAKKYGQTVVTPADICMQIMKDNYSPGVRAACFFLGLCFVISQIALSAVANAIPGGMDLTTLMPKYINTRRGAIIVFLLAWPAQPWSYYSSGAAFLNVMSSFSVFLTPIVAMSMCEYYVVRRRMVKLADCYIRGSQSLYWYNRGINFKAIICFILGSAPGIPGLIKAADDTVNMSQGILYFYKGGFVFQYLITFALYWIANLIYPSEVDGRDEADYFNTFTEEERRRWNIAGADDKEEVELDASSYEGTGKRYH
ncbi:AaceriAGL363Cp [[Ashbya] aceris (nom. inval.)]|nr:AaceriAGL363Cp [[Ashbya] aceris (nom. inval.)]